MSAFAVVHCRFVTGGVAQRDSWHPSDAANVKQVFFRLPRLRDSLQHRLLDARLCCLHGHRGFCLIATFYGAMLWFSAC